MRVKAIAITVLWFGGLITWLSMGVLMSVLWFSALIDWLGPVLGVLAGVVFVPGVVIFPAVYWFVEGTFPAAYFGYWGIGLAGMVAMVTAGKLVAG